MEAGFLGGGGTPVFHPPPPDEPCKVSLKHVHKIESPCMVTLKYKCNLIIIGAGVIARNI